MTFKKSTCRRHIWLVLVGALIWGTHACAATGKEPQADPDIPQGINLRQRYGWTPLHWAARHGQTSEIARLLDSGTAIETREHMQRTPLHLATMGGHRDAVELLLARGADVNARDRWNVTPLRRMELLQQVRQWNRTDMINLLMDSGGIR